MKIAEHSTFSAGDTDKSVGRRSAPAERNKDDGQGKDVGQERGSTTIADVVVQKIAGLAAREVSGVHALGGGAARAFGAVKGRIPGASAGPGQGVSVEVGRKQAAVDLQLVVEYGSVIPDLARAVRENIIDTVGEMTGLEVVEVNIDVDDVHVPGDPDDEDDKEGGGRVA
ncbi:Asp23/Gls24 family envelope stress response protein [Streptomyces sp. NPDC005805]|uniref:Asp23/Gls24 family envelope stress response protein n=1 Tax=Streptomyces sp. NPDC005805 TaxID=3157068 RepID=UPI0033C3DF2F